MKTNIAVLENNYFAAVPRESLQAGGVAVWRAFLLHRNDQNDAEVTMVPCAEITFPADNTAELLLCFDSFEHTHKSMHILTHIHIHSYLHTHQTHTHTHTHDLPHSHMHSHSYMLTHTHQKYMEK